MNEIYNRQSSLGLNIPKKIAVIGCGGIGSWLAINFALIGVEEILIFDSDKVEETNLNRTLFRLKDIGKYKVNAIRNLISERRLDTNVIAINRKYVEGKHDLNAYEYVFDCTDGINVKGAIKLGYDGLNYTIISNTTNAKVWGNVEQIRYTTIPSFLGTPQFIANIVTNCIVSGIPITDISDTIKNTLVRIFKKEEIC